MKIYFEDGRLNAHKAPKDAISCVDAQLGATDNYERLMLIKKIYEDQEAVYTNSLIALMYAGELGWNKETQQFDIYLRQKDGSWKSIGELTPKELRYAHNILKMWWAGEFEED